jgi:hypothetical protein
LLECIELLHIHMYVSDKDQHNASACIQKAVQYLNQVNAIILNGDTINELISMTDLEQVLDCSTFCRDMNALKSEYINGINTWPGKTVYTLRATNVAGLKIVPVQYQDKIYLAFVGTDDTYRIDGAHALLPTSEDKINTTHLVPLHYIISSPKILLDILLRMGANFRCKKDKHWTEETHIVDLKHSIYNRLDIESCEKIFPTTPTSYSIFALSSLFRAFQDCTPDYLQAPTLNVAFNILI